MEKDPALAALAERLNLKLEQRNGQWVAVAKDFGTADLLVVRETFKMPVMIALYTFLSSRPAFTAIMDFGRP